ncbi:MAG TPA: hypothetical protein PK264_20395, partial [Hyphomicrobiaceae bacterium]|nr:hypothetical protein [Hyphomicrobiaceae bacterium]
FRELPRACREPVVALAPPVLIPPSMAVATADPADASLTGEVATRRAPIELQAEVIGSGAAVSDAGSVRTISPGGLAAVTALAPPEPDMANEAKSEAAPPGRIAMRFALAPPEPDMASELGLPAIPVVMAVVVAVAPANPTATNPTTAPCVEVSAMELPLLHAVPAGEPVQPREPARSSDRASAMRSTASVVELRNRERGRRKGRPVYRLAVDFPIVELAHRG